MTDFTDDNLADAPLATPKKRAPLPLVAIVGRANVGKSTLFNHIVGRRRAIVEHTPGVTRDRHYERCEDYEKPFLLVDTGGLGLEPEGVERQVREQTLLAIEEANAIIFLVDGSVGLTAAEREIYDILRKQEVPVLIAANKMDIKGAEIQAQEIHELGVETIYPISAEHARNIDELIEALMEYLPEPPPEEARTEAAAGEETGEEEADEAARHLDRPIAIAVVGRPNVGKSTLINRLIGEERLVVSPIAGTTRDPIDTEVEINGQPYVLIDTAGIRRKARITHRVEGVSVLAAFRAVERSDVVVLVFDATEGMTEQDRRIAGLVEESGRALILVANKWDLVKEEDQGPLADPAAFEKRVRYLLPGLAWAPLLRISAHTGQALGRLVREIERVGPAFHARFSTSALNEVLQEIVEFRPPPNPHGRPIKLNFVRQVTTAPPTFMIMTNQVKDFPNHYRRYLANQFRERLGLECVPVHIKIKAKERRKMRGPRPEE